MILLLFSILLSPLHITRSLQDSLVTGEDQSIESRILDLSRQIEAHSDTLSLARYTFLLGKEYAKMDFTDKALEELNQSFRFYRAAGDSAGMADVLRQISFTYSLVQEYDKALDFILRARGYARDLKQTREINHRIGYVYFNLKQLDSAEKYLNIAVVQYARTGEVGANSMINLAGINIARARYKDGLSGLLQVEREGLQSLTPSAQYFVFNFISALYMKLGNAVMSRQYRSKRDSLSVDLAHLEKTLDFYETNIIADTLVGDYTAAVQKQGKYVEQLKSYYKNNLTTQLANYQKLFELQEKEMAIDLLEKENQVYELRQYESRSYIIILILGVTVLLLVILITYRSLSHRNKLNKELQALNAQISSQHDDLQHKNDLLKKIINDLKGTQYQLIQSEKMASIGSFASGVAHELNNPINILSGGLQVIEKNLAEVMNAHSETQEELLEDIYLMLRESNARISKINRIIQALIIATYTDHSPKILDFTEIVDNVLIAFSRTSHPEVRFSTKVDSVSLECFPNRIHHALKAVLENAFFFAKESASEEKCVWVAASQKGESLEVRIENNGPAIPEDHLIRIFDPFYTTKDDGVSPGLGLYFAFSAVKEHEGRIEAKNENDRVVFTMTLPVRMSTVPI
ncbi:MAG: ATP-binding protein [Marinoscillum sp.]|uniref:ATP-binding protein n=1 Tax=Marinoscillum sp. TaxID=2024838 RepID=UPI0032FDD04F